MSSDDVVDYAFYGIPLDSIEEDVPRKRPFGLEEQVVLDKQGRRRFHGAFTGGFSAGFFNTVGTLEGWKPTAFKSSRSERGGCISQKREDFMDEEDMDEFGIAPKVIKTKSDYKEQSVRKRGHIVAADGPIPGEPLLHSFLQPVRETVGVRLLKKMGWRPGQGVGPRLTKTEKKQVLKVQDQLRQKVYGCSLPREFGNSSTVVGEQESSDEEDFDNEILYAPDDIQPFKCVPKDDLFGIGYSGLDRRPILNADKYGDQKKSVLNLTENRKRISISGQAFGVGAFEEEDDDIYSTEDMSHYDFSLEERPEKKTGPKGSRWNEPVDSNYAGKPLEGFVLAKIKPALIYFPAPKLPPDFKPIHQVHQTRFGPALVQDEALGTDGRKKGLARHDLSAADRVAILSQRKLESPTTAPSVNEISIKIEPGLIHDTSESRVEFTISSLADKDVVSKNESQFRPFVSDPDKQHRYEQYLGLLKSNQKSKLTVLQPLSMMEWERDRERLEFEHASRLYCPLPRLMSNRFVSAIHPDVGDEGGSTGIMFPKEEESEKKKAAKMKMFGRLTRERMHWAPCSLLYKRFNVPDPGISAYPEVRRPPSKFSVFDFMASASHNSMSSNVKEPTFESNRVVGTIDESLSTMEDVPKAPLDMLPPVKETIQMEPSNGDKFPNSKIDLFKAIFLSSSESEEEAEITPKDESKEDATYVEKKGNYSDKLRESSTPDDVLPASEMNIQRNLSPARGVFANLDLDAINQRLKQERDKVNEIMCQKEEVPSVSEMIDVDVESGVYGPRLPVKPSSETIKRMVSETVIVLSGSDSSTEVEWVEKSTKKHKKGKHHKKYKRHKSKYKHQKQKKEQSH